MKGCVLTIAGILAFVMPSVYAKDFNDYVKENKQGVEQQYTSYNQYKNAYLSEYKKYKEKIYEEWDEARTSSPKTWVSYSKDMKTRTTVDYENNTVELAIRDDAAPTAKRIRDEISKSLNSTAQQALNTDPVLNQVESDYIEDLGGLLMAGIAVTRDAVDALVAKGKQLLKQDSHGEYTVIKVEMPSGTEQARASQLMPYVKKYSKKYNISPSLILAIIKTESAFNPLAQSHIPAFGLMQIVPSTAGVDVQKLLYGEKRKPSAKMLFNPETNIEHGVAYLYILQNQYLKGIRDNQSLEFCSVAAYNTGAGNVARAFVGSTDIKKAIPLINSMSSDEVYGFLRSKLKHEEARNYVLKVRKSKQQFSI